MRNKRARASDQDRGGVASKAMARTNERRKRMRWLVDTCLSREHAGLPRAREADHIRR